MQIPGDRDMPDKYTNYARDWLGPLEKMLKERNEGRCNTFIYGFGWKDADLDPEGCTGIVKIEPGVENNFEDFVRVTVSGHKTFCDPSYDMDEEYPEEVKNSLMDVA